MSAVQSRNIPIAYALGALRNSWFWLGIWVFYYLRFTDYAGIGLIETVLIITMTVMEIPTGVIADLLGKKPTLILSFLLQAINNLVIAFAPNLSFLLLAALIGGLGGTLYSGAMEALIYDSLKERNQEGRYHKILGNVFSLQFVMMAVTGSIGGFLYGVDPRLPFIASGFGYLVATLLSFALREPPIDTEKFSLHIFLAQNKRGLMQLFGRREVRMLIFFLVSIASIGVVADEMLNDVLAVEFGFQPHQLGVFIAVVSLISAAVSQFSSRIIRRVGSINTVVLLGLILSMTYLLSPWVGIVVGGLTLLLRVSFQSIVHNATSGVINQHTESRYRATTLSSFNMIKNLPYVFSAYLLGSLMDIITVRIFAFVLGIAVLAIIGLFLAARDARMVTVE